MTTKIFEVSGMTCSGCVRTVETIIKKQAGVQSASVTLTPGKAEVTFDETTISTEKIIQAVGSMGYTMSVKQA